MMGNAMLRRILVSLLLPLAIGCGHWTDVGPHYTDVAPGLRYAELRREGLEAHVIRVDLHEASIRVFASDETDRGLRVGEFAAKRGALVAVNADYFDEQYRPVGLAIGSCGRWESAGSARRQWVVGFAKGHDVEIFRPSSLDEPAPEWVEHAVSGWPLLVENCRALGPDDLPGSDHFTRAPHPRTAVGLDREGGALFLVVVDGRREGVPGVTLAELGELMRNELGACTALNLDGGGSSEMVVSGRIVNQPSDGSERPVANHIGVIREKDYAGCAMEPE